MTTARHKGDVAFEGAVDLSGADVTMPIAGLASDDNVTWTGDHTFEGDVVLPAAVVDPANLSSGYRVVANDGAVVIAATDRFIRISKTANTTTAITMTATHAGHVVVIEMTAGDADSVYTAAVTGGTVTFNAALERCRFIYDGAAWIHQIETGATFA